MPNSNTHRLDELRLDQRIAGEARGFSSSPAIQAVYERREIDPTAPYLRRRHGSQRVTDAQPNLVGATYNGGSGSIHVDRDFTTDLANDGTNRFTMFGTLFIPTITSEEVEYAKIVSVAGIQVYAKRSFVSPNWYVTIVVHNNATLIASSSALQLDAGGTGTAIRFMVRRGGASTVEVNAWDVGDDPGTDGTGSHTFVADGDLEFFGANHSSLSNSLPEVVLNNFLLYDADTFGAASSTWETICADLMPETDYGDSGVLLLWHDTFSSGGNVLSYTSDGDVVINAYLVATPPQKDASSATDILFGGEGVVEIPFYPDFDEFYWTTTHASARLDWSFQLKFTTPAVLVDALIFEFQDLIKVEITASKIRASYNAAATVINHSTTLVGATAYDLFIARDGDSGYLKIADVEVEDTAISIPVIFSYDKTLQYIIGDGADFENTSPFKGRLERFALHLTSLRTFQEKDDAVVYYDINSVLGDELLDRGNRALNAYLGVRSSAQAPFYKIGGFPGGSYVAAVGGYLVSNGLPDIGYSGILRAPLLKDSVVQRRGRRSFLTSNGWTYLIDDLTGTFRPLGIPRPTTKVSCSPQGLGAIDGFVKYAYRYVTIDGTVGPAFELDPCNAQGGVNVFLGADTFSMPDDPAFGLSFGETEGTKLVANDEVEVFFARDKDSDNAQLLHKETDLTAEVAFRLPSLSSTARESVVSQGVYCPYVFGVPPEWFSLNDPKRFPWITKQNQESSFQFSFRFRTGSHQSAQVLFAVGYHHQRTSGDWQSSGRYRLQALVVSIQFPAVADNNYSLVVCRDNSHGSHYGNNLNHSQFDYDFIDGRDYTLFLSRGGSIEGFIPGTSLKAAIYDHTANGWGVWKATSGPQIVVENFWPSTYSSNVGDQVMWGTGRYQSDVNVKTRWHAAPAASATYDHIRPFWNKTKADGTGGQRMYHGRMWRKDFPITLLANKGLERYGARTGPLSVGLEIDVAFCSDSTKDELEGGWDVKNEIRTRYRIKTGEINAKVVLSADVEQTVFFAYGHDAKITDGGSSPDTHDTTTTAKIPIWCAYTNRNEGSLLISTGQFPAVEIAKKKWHDGSFVRTFDDFAGEGGAGAIDVTEWTWITMYFRQITRPGTSGTLDVWLVRVFIDGNTGEWGDLFNSDTTPAGPGGKHRNTDTGPGKYTLYTVGGVSGIDADYEVEIAEARLWPGERYRAEGMQGGGPETFGDFLSARLPPNIWDELWHYLRFSPVDVNDMDSQTSMDNHGAYAESGGNPQASKDAVSIYQGAEVKRASGEGESGGDAYFVPFPTPPLGAIRGIQIFRTQVVPVVDKYPNGSTNPNGEIEAFKVARTAPLYFLTEIPDGTDFYFDTASDDFLGEQLDLSEGLIPPAPGGSFEWHGYLALWVTDVPRIYFAASPTSWESFPGSRVLDLPLREHGTITAAVELASRDARNSRVLVMGKSWGVFLDGSPLAPQTNSLGGGVGAASSRCLVVEKGIAYAYNGTLWAISGEGQIEDIGLPVIDLLPPPASARLSVSSTLGSLFVINEDTGLTLRWHYARREWFVEDRHALSVTDIDGVDNWVQLTGYPAAGDTASFMDDRNATGTTFSTYTVLSYVNGTQGTINVSNTTGLAKGMRLTVAANLDPRERQTVTIQSLAGGTITINETLALSSTSGGGVGTGTLSSLAYTVYPGVGYWGTMIDTGQFNNGGTVSHVGIGILSGTAWYGMHAGRDFALDPSDRAVFDTVESYPTLITESDKWGLTMRQRLQRLIFWSFEGTEVGLSELEVSFVNDDSRGQPGA